MHSSNPVNPSYNPRNACLGLFDPQTDGLFLAFSTLEDARRCFGGSVFGNARNLVFAVAVPSVIVPVWNVVLYPQARGFWDHVSLESVEPFEFDPRLFPEGAPVESAR
jgi:hypothetical protein